MKKNANFESFMRVLSIFFLILCFGCHVATPVKKNILRIAFAQDPVTIDPRKSGDFTSSTLICLLYEGLMRCTKDSEVELALAERVEISQDGKTYRFFLRSSNWSDGHPVTAYDFEHSWKKILEPTFPAPCAYLLYPIKNGENYAKGLCSSDDVGIHALNAHLLQVELEHPTPYFLALTAFPLYLPVPAHIEPTWDGRLVCNGPFCMHHITAQHEILLQKNPDFWNPDSIHLDNIHISIIADDMAALQLFEEGELDLVGGPFTLIPLDALQDQHPLFLPMAASTFCTFNTQTFPFQNAALRKAFAIAMQRGSLAQEIEDLGGLPASTFLPPSLSYASYAHNMEDPHLLLTQALNELSITPSDLSSLVLYYKATSTDKKIAQTIQKQIQGMLGISIQIEQTDPKALLQRLYNKNYQLSLASWIAQFHDPINILERFKDPKNAKNYPGWDNTEYAQILGQAASTPDPQSREKLLADAEQLIHNETILAPLYHWRSPMLVHPRVQGLETTSAGGILIEHCFIN